MWEGGKGEEGGKDKGEEGGRPGKEVRVSCNKCAWLTPLSIELNSCNAAPSPAPLTCIVNTSSSSLLSITLH